MIKPRLFLAVAAMVASGAFGLTAFQKSLTPYVSFREAQAASGMVQVSGDVQRAQVSYDPRTGTLLFPLKDHEGSVMTVVSHDGMPNNFDRAEKVVAVGQCQNGVFQADHLLTKCPSKYKAEPGAAPAPPNSPANRANQGGAPGVTPVIAQRGG